MVFTMTTISMALGVLGAAGAIALGNPDVGSAQRPVSASAALAPAAPVADTVSVAPRALKTITFSVEGMTCGGCAIATRTVLKRLDGVKTAKVSYETKRAVVTYDASKVTVQQMIAAIGKAGFTATVVAG